ncbi:recombinase family protein [Mycobacterium marseillense]|uniref:Serine recombinase n=1 Tax=Mycobacterium marseillense TaxID=701042 RepID=A0AAC9YPC9_9MYCO|nr:recombinase family protein [Mycobacterium marseillense]ASW93084.1 serine recombinase [Mycobacterium marseillense]
MRAAIYTRISLDQTGEGRGVERQLDDCLKLADQLGWEVTARYDDNDISAFSGKARPGFESMLDGMKRGEFGALLCWHTDRLYRSMKDLERLIDIAEERRVQIRTVQGGDLDLSTSAGRMVARILGSVSRQESEHKGERQKRANAQQAAAGKWRTANRPFGYTTSGRLLESEAIHLRQAMLDVLAGKSISQVAREWNALGLRGTRGTSWSSPRIRRLLVNPRYARIPVYRGKPVENVVGDWDELIDVDTHRGLVAFLCDPSRLTCTSFEKVHIGSGVYLCGICDAPMRHAFAGRPRVRRYECSAKQHVTRRGEPVDALVEELVLERLSSPQVRLVVDSGEKVDVAELQAKRAALQARLDELAGLFAEGSIDGSQLRRGSSDLRAQVSAVDSVLADLAHTSPVADLLAAGEKLRERWAELTPDIKSKVIRETVTIRIMPAPRGYLPFKPELIAPEWKV